MKTDGSAGLQAMSTSSAAARLLRTGQLKTWIRDETSSFAAIGAFIYEFLRWEVCARAGVARSDATL